MSTITDATGTRRQRLVAMAALGAGVLGAWLVVLLGITLVAEPTRDVVVLGPAHAAERAQVAIADAPGGWLKVRGLAPGYVRELYAGGAWLVLPARSGTCGSARAAVAFGVDRARITQARAE